MTGDALIAGLFRSEFAKMVAVLSRHFGLAHIEIAEDIVSETFLTAAEAWGQKGTPENPVAWLYAVAKQKTLYYFRRNKIFDEKIAPRLASEQPLVHEDKEPDFSPAAILDSQLKMLFAVCNPAIQSEAQIGLALRILCGFGIEEIAEAFLSNKETINKRLYRAKEKLRSEKIELELPAAADLLQRLDNVLHIIYLVFNEGYYSRTQNEILRRDLCYEAMRLGTMLSEFGPTALPETHALLALMCFHASRFAAREGADSPVLYAEQNESLWDQDLIGQGIRFWERSATGAKLSPYHLEAGIAFWHCRKTDADGKWPAILELYDQLLAVRYSPAAALNRIYALFRVHGAEQALAAAEKLNLSHSHFFHVLLAELTQATDTRLAVAHLQRAKMLAHTETERALIEQRLKKLG